MVRRYPPLVSRSVSWFALARRLARPGLDRSGRFAWRAPLRRFAWRASRRRRLDGRGFGAPAGSAPPLLGGGRSVARLGVDQCHGLVEGHGLGRFVRRQRGIDAVVTDIGAIAAVLG